ncbi:MAG: ABC transporter permease [SAR86 cluster bacterium]|jgi:putative ABC transport system permease protein|nr:ABC transporter permease [SAR86 cluster bacterium]
MIIEESVNSALDSIKTNLLRSLLTALAIIIGTAAVIAMVGIGTGAQQAIEDSISSLGAKTVSVFPGQKKKRGIRSSWVALWLNDAEALSKDSEIAWRISPEMHGNKQVKFGDKNANFSVNGVQPNFFSVNSFILTKGKLFSENDNFSRKRVAVLGNAVQEELKIPEEMLLNKEIQIGGISFKVIGFLGEKGSGGWENTDEKIYIPMMTASTRVYGRKWINTVRIQIPEGTSINKAMMSIERVLRREHDIGPGEDNDFRIIDWSQIQQIQKDATAIFTTLIAGIAGISLLVGGIGVMNIMLVSVTERTKEIGLRKALGATPRAILFQFIIEAIILCMIGGIIGALLGTFLYFLAASFSEQLPFVLPILAIFGSITFSACVGLFFGIWPAKRAARLDPAVALQYE